MTQGMLRVKHVEVSVSGDIREAVKELDVAVRDRVEELLRHLAKARVIRSDDQVLYHVVSALTEALKKSKEQMFRIFRSQKIDHFVYPQRYYSASSLILLDPCFYITYVFFKIARYNNTSFRYGCKVSCGNTHLFQIQEERV